MSEPALLDSDVLSLLSRGHARVSERAAAYLAEHGRLTLSAVTVFERLRGYRSAIRAGKPFEDQLRSFQLLAAACIVLPMDVRTADVAATVWAHLPARRRSAIGDILIASTAAAHDLTLV